MKCEGVKYIGEKVYMLGNSMPSNYTENIRAGLLPEEKISWVIKL
jgi:hypothetical protein